jgi:hypothetical protein
MALPVSTGGAVCVLPPRARSKTPYTFVEYALSSFTRLT